MRLIGNKSRLLGEIEALLRDRGLSGGTLVDIFCGTASVGRHFKSLGFRVIANDHLSMCYTKAVAEVEVSQYPAFEALRKKYSEIFRSPDFAQTFSAQGSLCFDGASALELAKVIHLLDRYVEPEEGLIFRNYCPGGGKGRLYFIDENGRKIDGILGFLRENYRQETLSREELYLLLSSLLDAADRVANISGTYGAYLKSLQRNAVAALQLKVPEVLVSPLKHQAFQEDSNELVRRVKGDVLYIDPPYNHRQYAANYHVLDIIAELHKIDDLVQYEASLYGKTGLRPYESFRSAYCVPPSPRSKGNNVLSAMTDLILSSKCKHVVVSYNEEGLLTRDELGAILSRFSGSRSFDFEKNQRAVLYRRFRSDADRDPESGKGTRRYKVLDGKGRNEISEWLFFASRARSRAGRSARQPPLTAPAKAARKKIAERAS